MYRVNPAPLLLVLPLLALAHAAPAQAWREGEPLPALRLPTIDGKATVDLRALCGKRTLLIEFASW
jgi:hypothetical protein